VDLAANERVNLGAKAARRSSWTLPAAFSRFASRRLIALLRRCGELADPQLACGRMIISRGWSAAVGITAPAAAGEQTSRALRARGRFGFDACERLPRAFRRPMEVASCLAYGCSHDRDCRRKRFCRRWTPHCGVR
jgi:hypothetical protein